MIRTLQSEWQELNSGAYPNLRAQGWRERNSRCIGYGRRICRDARDFVVLLSMRESAWTRNCIRHGARNRGRVRRGLGCGREGKNFVKGNAVSSSSIRHNSATCVKSDARSRETTFVSSLDWVSVSSIRAITTFPLLKSFTIKLHCRQFGRKPIHTCFQWHIRIWCPLYCVLTGPPQRRTYPFEVQGTFRDS